MKPTQYQFEILGKPWTLRLMKRGKYKTKIGSDSVALTTFYKRRIDLSPFGRDLETIIHELTHAYLHEMCQPDPHSVQIDELEETYCELMAKRGKELIALAEHLFEMIHSKPL
jgi:hypothetical protein